MLPWSKSCSLLLMYIQYDLRKQKRRGDKTSLTRMIFRCSMINQDVSRAIREMKCSWKETPADYHGEITSTAILRKEFVIRGNVGICFVTKFIPQKSAAELANIYKQKDFAYNSKLLSFSLFSSCLYFLSSPTLRNDGIKAGRTRRPKRVGGAQSGASTSEDCVGRSHLCFWHSESKHELQNFADASEYFNANSDVPIPIFDLPRICA